MQPTDQQPVQRFGRQPVRLRPYHERDAAPVLALNQSNLDGVGPLDPARLRWLVGMTSQALVADNDGTPAGFAFVIPARTDYDSRNYAWFGERFDEFGYLDRIVVAPGHRRRGIASLLYDAAEADARGSGRLLCEVYVDPPNEPSLAFHAGRGYQEVGQLPQADGKTCAMLAKDLTQHS